MEWLLMACLALCAASAAQNADEETDGQSSRKILGSSVVTSVSVVMETGNGKHTYFADAVGHPLSKPHIASQVASPINLLNPDRYEFYTFNDDGELVKRLMTLEEIQGIIAGGDGEASNYNSEYHAQIHHPENDVSGVVENVQNVLKEEMEAHKNPLEDPPIMDTPDVSSTWNLILPAFFGGDTVTIRETPEDKFHYVSQMVPLEQSTERMNVSSKNPEDADENNIPNMVEINESTTESRTVENLPSTYSSSIMTEHTRPIPIVITTEKLKPDDLSSSTAKNEITSELPVQTKVTDQDIYIFDGNKIDISTENNLDDMTDNIMSSFANSITTQNNKIYNFPEVTERVNLKDNDQIFSQTIEYPKITQLVSMITRPTTKASEKTTTASVTFPPATQFTHSGQISQSSATLKPVYIKEKNTETPPLTSSDIIDDNFVILSLNNDKNDYLEQDLNNDTVQEVKNGTQLDATKYDVILNVEQIIENVTKNDVADDEKIPVENYDVTEEIQELLKVPDFNKSVTLASSIIDSNKIFTTTENIPKTSIISATNEIITTETQEMTSTPLLQSTPLMTTMQKVQMLTTTPIPYLKENTKTTIPTIKTTMIPLTFTPMKQSATTEQVTTSKLPMISRTVPSTTFRSTERTKIFTAPKLPETTTEQFVTNRIIVPSITTTSATVNTKTSPLTTLTTIADPTKLTTISKPVTPQLNLTTTQRITTEKITTPLVVTTTTKKQTIPTTILNKISMVTTATTMEPITLITKQINNNIQSTTMPPQTTTPVTTKKLILPSSTTVKTTRPITVTPKIIPTTLPPISTTNGVVNISEPYRKTEEYIPPNKIPISGDTWKLVDTMRPPEYTSNKMPNTSMIHVASHKPVLAPYQPPIKVDLSTQGNFEIPGLNDDMFMFSKMYNELALKFWSALSIKDIQSERSAVVSPFGAYSILAMIFLGARGSTSEEMNDVLKLDDIVTFNPHLVFKEVTESVIARKSPSAIVRELYSDSYKGKVHGFYKERVRQFYDGHVEEVDFKKIHNVIRRRTNALISKQTRGQLPQYLEETTLSLRAPLSTLSTNIFQADCSQASTEGRDGELYFIVLPSIRQRRLVPIPAAVWRTGFIAGYDPELDATAVSLGTMNQVVSTVLVMPGQQGHSAPGDVLLRLEARLLNTTYIPETWTQLLKSMLPRPGLEIQLPRFLHKSVINATEALKRMGLQEMFSKNKADFRGINGVGHDLHFSDMIQINEFSVCGDTQQMHTEIYPSMTEHLENHNEQMRNFKYVEYFEENEYDKYSSIPLPLRPRQARLPEIPRLRFDRPFLYFVRHNPTGLILHMGRFNPRLVT